MSFFNYVSSLLPSFEKRRVMQDIDNLRQSLVEFTLPPYNNAVDVFDRDWKWKSRDLEKFDKELVRKAKTDFKGNYVMIIQKTLNRVSDNMDTLENLIDKSFQDDIVGRVLTYQRATMLRYVEMIGFAIRYSNLLLRWTFAMEHTARGNDRSGQVLPAEEKWLKEKEGEFFEAIRVLSTTKKDLVDSIEKVPNVEITEDNEETVAATMGINRLNPMRMNLISKDWNPIYHVRMAIADWQVNRYKANKEERRVLEYQLMRMKERLENDTDNAQLAAEVDAASNRLEKLNHSIKKMEDRYA